MASLVQVLDRYIFSGVPSNAVYDVIKVAWEKTSQKSWEEIYLDAFEAAVEEARPRLQRYCGDDGEIGLDRDALAKTLCRDLHIGLDNLSLSTLGSDEFAEQLAEAMEARSVLVIGGNTLSREDYAQLTRNLVRHATNRFKTAVLANEFTFRQALLAEVQGNEALISQVQVYLIERFDLALEKLDTIEAGIQRVERKVDELPAQIEQVVRDTVRSIPDVTVERDQLKLELKTERERRWQDQYEELRAQVNAGYVTAARLDIVTLVDEIEGRVKAGDSISDELKGRIYRLATSAFIPGKPGGDLQRCRNYLMKARAFSSDEELVKCQIIEALIAYPTHGLRPALALLEGLDDEEVMRLRFSLYLENDQLVECRRMIEQGEVDKTKITQDPNWARIFTLYYAAAGEPDKLEHALEALTRDHPTADHFEVAGLALTRMAFGRFRRFCSDHHVFPEFHLMLDLGDLIDQAAYNRAINHFAEASKLYQLNNCHIDAVRTLTAALRLQVDAAGSSSKAPLIERLQELDPDNLLLLHAQELPTDAEATPAFDELERMFEDPPADPMLLLSVADRIAVDPSLAKSIADLLQGHSELFRVRDSTLVQFQFVVLQLLEKAGLEEEAEAWLGQASTPEPHAHLRPLWHVGFYLERDLDRAAEWLEQAQAIAPDQPEVLAVSIMVYRRQGRRDAEMECAQRLFEILRTCQTAGWLLDALWTGERWTDLLQVIEDTSDLALSEASTRAARAYAHLRLDRPFDAHDDLEWLRQHQKAKVPDLLNLARINQCLRCPDDAIAVLKDCVDRYPDEPDGYLELSQALLDEGRRGDSFRWALAARERFPDDPYVATHLFYIGFPTGYELREEVGQAFREFMPRGRFADTGFFQQRDISELVEFMRSERERIENLEQSYRQGQIPSMMLCYALGTPLFQFHFLGTRFPSWRFAALGNQSYETDVPAIQWPREVVLDYSALLTLWSLLGEDVLIVLQAHFDRVWMPAKLLLSLHWEQRQFAQKGQLALYKARIALKDKVVHQSFQFPRHARVDPPDGWDVTGAYTEMTIAQTHDLVHLDEYVPDDREIVVPTIGLWTLAGLLYKAGEIGPTEYAALIEHAKPAGPDEERYKAQLSKGSEIVADIPTLTQIAMADALDGLCRYFGHIHLSDPAWHTLLRDIAAVEHNQQMVDELRTLRDLLREGIDSGFIKVESLAPEQRLIGKPADEGGNRDEPDIPDDSILQLSFDYADELLGLAHFKQLPIWTDDRWTCRLHMQERYPLFIFGTDIFLERLRTEGALEEDVAFAHYGKLIRWGYLGLSIHPEYIRWLLQQGVPPESKVLTDAAAVYRNSVIELRKAVLEEGSFSREFALHVFGHYNQQLFATLRRLFEDQVDVAQAAAVFRELDLSRYAAWLEGQEPFYLGSLLLKPVIGAEQDDSNVIESPHVTEEFSRWLDEVLLEAGVKAEEIDEAWYLLTQNFLSVYDSAAMESNKQAALAFMVQLFDVMSERAMGYLLTTDLGDRLRQNFGLKLESRLFFEFAQPDGQPTRLTYREEEWHRDFDEAVDRYLAAPTDALIRAGAVTIQAADYVPGSMFLRFREAPTEAVQQHGYIPAGGPVRYLCILHGFLNADAQRRATLWDIGHQKLLDTGLSADEWERLRDALLSDDADTWRAAGHRARCHLLGQRQIAQDYLAEATTLGIPAIQELVRYAELEVVRAWLDMPELDWETGQDLEDWAKGMTSSAPFAPAGDEPAKTLRRFVARFGRSIFPDARLYREWVLTQIGQAGTLEEQQKLLEGLIELARSIVSLSLKANVLLILLAWRSRNLTSDLGGSSPLDPAIADLAEQIALGRGCQDPLQATLVDLEPLLCNYLYTVWSRSLEYSGSQPEELAYLAHVGASLIVDALAGYIPHQMADTVVDQLHSQMQQDQLSQGLVEQPQGFFRPVWSLHFSYAMSFLLESASREEFDLTPITLNESTRGTLLQCGAVYRVIQAYMDNAGMERSWLDEHLATDIGGTVAQLLAGEGEEHLASWPAPQQHAWHVCATPDAGIGLALEAVMRVPETDNDEEVTRSIGLAFLGIGSPGSTWPAYVRGLLTTEPLQRIRQSPACYGELIWRLGALLLDPEGLDPQLVHGARDLLFEIPTEEPNLKELIEVKADVLSQLIGLGFNIEEIVSWIKKTAAHEDLPLLIIRGALRPFARLLPQYPPEIKQALGRSMTELQEEPRICALWEVHRIVRDRQKDRNSIAEASL